MVYLNFLVQDIFCIAAFLLGLAHLEVCAFLHVAALPVHFGFHLLELIFEVGNHIGSILAEETEA